MIVNSAPGNPDGTPPVQIKGENFNVIHNSTVNNGKTPKKAKKAESQSGYSLDDGSMGKDGFLLCNI